MGILNTISGSSKKLAVLIDPDKISGRSALSQLCQRIEASYIDYIFVGGSIVEENDFHEAVLHIKSNTTLPVVIFPGHPNQLSNLADGLLLLSLISGRNPDFLIGHHVNAARKIKNLECEIIPTGYILVDGEKLTAVQYVSQTTPLPQGNLNIGVSTALAGELLGLNAIFLDAGSGANRTVDVNLIKAIKDEVQIPIIVGGGITSIEEIINIENAGANLIVIGNKIENDPAFLEDIKEYKSLSIL